MINYTKSSEFSSVFATHIIEYLTLKEAFGFKICTQGNVLRQFDRYCVEIGQKEVFLDETLANNWLASNHSNKQSTRASKISTLKNFKIYLTSLGIKNTWEPSPGYARGDTKYAPYIFTEQEIKNIFESAVTLEKPFGNSMFHIIFPSILKILYGTGMRISEVLNLKTSDIDLKNGTILVRNAKFDKCRKLPISESLLTTLRNYEQENIIQVSNSQNHYFFPNQYGDKYSQRTVYDKFRTILWLAGIPHRGRGKGPRVHDFRHTFAVHSLNQMLHNNKDIYVALTTLMVYLGHSKISATEYYLRLTAEFYPEFLEKSNAIAEKVIPEVRFYE